MTLVCEAPPTARETFSDGELRRAVRAKLPAHVYQRRPWRLAWVAVLLGIIVACGYGAMHTPWYLAIPLAILAGHSYGSMMFFAHEIAHGAVTGSRWLQDVVLYLASAIYCLSPKFWRLWHNGVHHGHANEPEVDPDSYGNLERYERSGWFRKFVIHYGPGSGSILSIFFPFVFFTGQAQGVFFGDTVGSSQFEGLNRTRVKIESLLMLGGWVTLCILTGWRGTLFVVVIPWLIANFLIMSYIFTNHLLRPLTESTSALDGAMSVRTIWLFDKLHFNFSHHIEHHLLPSVGSNHYPLVRQALIEIAGDRYLAPPHWWALRVLYKTPRVYAEPTELIEPTTGRRVSIASVEELLAIH